MSKTKALNILHIINNNPLHIVLVVEFNNEIVAASTLILEPKFIHGGKYVGHIEDVVVHPKHRHKKIGSMLINELLQYAKRNNCYKTILNCEESMKLFYEKLGFRNVQFSMRLDY
ncbi:MAG: GNAT family N-acetyltransferase [Thaumarchaeota archaeon]|nr:GNAT family N-acetyltransferase [Nitrososphaerota archaeon]